MKTDRKALHGALKELCRLIPGKPKLPILEQVRLTAMGGTLRLTVTDLKQTLTCELPAEGTIDTCLPCKALTRALEPQTRKAGGTVELLAEPGKVALTVDGMTSRLPATDPNTFPAGPVPEDGKPWSLVAIWPAPPLAEALDFVLPAAGNDPTREHLCTVHFNDSDIVATDGSRLHLAPLPAPTSQSLLIPAAAAATLARILHHGEQAVLARAGNLLRARCGPCQLDAHLSEKQFPPYRQVIPTTDGRPLRLELQTDTLKSAITRVAKLTRDKKLRVRINGAMTLTTWNADDGAAEIAVPLLQSTHEGEDLLTGFETRFLLDALAPAPGTVTMTLGLPLDPLRVDLPAGKLAVVMPLRL